MTRQTDRDEGRGGGGGRGGYKPETDETMHSVDLDLVSK